MDLYPFKSGLHMMEPVAMPNYYVDIQYANEEHFRKVLFVDPIPPFQFLDFGAINADVASVPTEAINLQMNDNQFGQFRWFPIDPIQVIQYLPNANAMHSLKNIIVPVDENIVTRDPDLHFTEFFVWQKNDPFFVALNYTANNLTTARLVGMGFKFIVTKDELSPDIIKNIQSGVTPCTVIPCYGRV